MARRRMIARGAGTVGGIVSTIIVGTLAVGMEQNRQRNENYNNASKEEQARLNKKTKDDIKVGFIFSLILAAIVYIVGSILCQ